ncbi:hypothetical protein GE061_006353 [Apolygus lucorum]|uniref:Uncharacterized protein n=1 Tax=Apolygus lucorum TaxID=248454 RepID=A0A6A4J8E2_APOLU|nr:hypothetical protein GE061_006353 [Apolygus lucorum]
MAKVARVEGDFTPVASELDYQDEVALKRKIAGNTPPNHILLLTVINPFYPISVNIVYSICKSFGKILRIVVFRKNGVQSMVEFESVEVAEKAKTDLDDKEIYTGCCRLKVEFAKPMRLNVVRNNSDTWDYTKESAPEMVESNGSQPGSGLLGFPPTDVVKQEFIETEQISAPAIAIAYPATVEFYDPMSMKYDDYSEYGSVVMAYNLNKMMTPDGLFNLLCMYGNVWKVKFLKSKKGCAMVQMGDRQGAERCLAYLQGVPLFNDTLQLGISKQPFLGDMGRGFELPDGTNSWKDFSNSKNNRFLTPAMANKNRLNFPSKVLHFFNMPPDLTEERLELFVMNTTKITLVDITVFPNKSEKCSSGLMEFESIADAITCVVLCNNVPMHSVDNGPPFFIKLCFSSVSSIAVAEREYEKRYLKYEKTDWL